MVFFLICIQIKWKIELKENIFMYFMMAGLKTGTIVQIKYSDFLKLNQFYLFTSFATIAV